MVELKKKNDLFSIKEYEGKMVEIDVDMGGSQRSQPSVGVIMGVDEFGFLHINVGTADKISINSISIAHIIKIKEKIIKPVVKVREEDKSQAVLNQERIDREKNKKSTPNFK